MDRAEEFEKAFKQGAKDMRNGCVSKENDSVPCIWVKGTYDSKTVGSRVILHKFGAKIIAASLYPVEDDDAVLPDGVEPVTDPDEVKICQQDEKRHNNDTGVSPTLNEIEGLARMKAVVNKHITDKMTDKLTKVDKNLVVEENTASDDTLTDW